MKITFQTGALLAAFGIGFLTGRNKVGSGGVEAGAASAESFQRRTDSGGSELVSHQRASEAEVRFLTKRRAFEKGGAKRWVENQFADILNGFDGRGDHVAFLKELAYLDTEMLKEAAAAWTEARCEVPVTEENVDGYSWWIGLLETDLYLLLAKTAPEQALDYLVTQTEGKKNYHTIATLFGSLFNKNPLLVKPELDKLNEREKSAAVQGIIDVLAVGDPERALIEAASFNLRSADSSAADAASRLVKRDPQRAMELAAKVSETAVGDRALKAAAELWAEKDAPAAEAWLRENKSTGRNDALSLLLWKRLDTDFDQIVKDFPSLIAGSEIKDETTNLSARLVREQMEKRSLEEAADWTLRLPEGRVRDVSQMVVAEKLVETDTLKASEWIRQMPPSLQRDVSTEKLVQAIQHSDPEAALEWAKVIDKPEMKQKALDGIFENWQKTDPEAAAERARVELRSGN